MKVIANPADRTDARYARDGGWKVYLTVGPDSYEKDAGAIKRWLKRHFSNYPPSVYNHLLGGDKHEKDFVVYLGSYATMMRFVSTLEASPVCRHLAASKAGSSGRIVGSTGKCSARFDPRGALAGHDWYRGWNGVPFNDPDLAKRIGGAKAAPLAEVRKAEMRQLFGTYFLPEGVE